jgi:outer membrane immunogenic protein
MRTFLRATAAVVLAGALASTAFAQPEPDATVHFHGGSVGFVVGVGGASGVVEFRGEKYPISVNGLSVGTIGANSYDVEGQVFHLHHIADIEGTYAAAEASATAGPGAGGIDMTNGNGVEIRATSTSSGLKLSLGASGVTIRLKH